nr:MAG TPA: hypothetical protein [Caudoviricetes sp.]
MLTRQVLPCDTTGVHDEGSAVDQEVNTGALLLVTVNLSRDETNRIAVAIGKRTLTEQVGGINTTLNRATVIHDDTPTLVGVELHRSAVTLSLNQVLLLQVCLGCAVHSNSSQLGLSVTKQLTSINESRCRNVLCSSAGHGGDVQDVVSQRGLVVVTTGRIVVISAKDTGQDLDQNALVLTAPIASNQVADCSHRISTSQGSRQVSCRPHCSLADGGGHILVAGDLLGGQILTFQNVLRITVQILKERHVVDRCCFRSQLVKFGVVGDDAGLEQCRQFHGLVNHIGIEQFRHDHIRKSSTVCHIVISFLSWFLDRQRDTGSSCKLFCLCRIGFQDSALFSKVERFLLPGIGHTTGRSCATGSGVIPTLSIGLEQMGCGFLQGLQNIVHTNRGTILVKGELVQTALLIDQVVRVNGSRFRQLGFQGIGLCRFHLISLKGLDLILIRLDLLLKFLIVTSILLQGSDGVRCGFQFVDLGVEVILGNCILGELSFHSVHDRCDIQLSVSNGSTFQNCL